MRSGRKSTLHELRWVICLVGLMSLAVLLVTGCGSPFRKLSESEVDAEMISAAKRIATDILESHRDGRFEPLGDEATPAMRSALTPEKQKEAYETIKGMFGDFQSMEYVETCVPKDGSLLFIHRFKGHFSKSQARPEIRVVMDSEGKLAGFWIKPWRAKVQ